MELLLAVTGMLVLAVPANAAPAGVQCGDTLTGSVQLDADLNCTGTALTIAADGVTVDLGGHTVVGTTSGISARAQTGVTITNGTVGGGIALTQEKSSTLSNLRVDSIALNPFSDAVVTDSVIEQGKISVQGAISLVRCSLTGVRGIAQYSAITMTGSTVTDSGFISEATNFTLHGNTLTRSHLSGDESGTQVVTDNKFVQSEMNFYIARSLDFENNRFTGDGSGLTVYDTIAKTSTIRGNVFDGAKVGLEIYTTDFERINDVSISRNVFVNNAAAGILLEGGKFPNSRSVAISDNVFASNGKASNGSVDTHGAAIDDGLHVDVPSASLVTIGANFTLNNADHGIEARPGTVIDGGGNVSVGDPAGCLGVVCT